MSVRGFLRHIRTQALGEGHYSFLRSEIAHFVIAVTAAGAITRHVRPQLDGLSYRISRLGFWVASPSNARAPSLSQSVDPHQMMMNAGAMPTTEFVDYSFVFVH